MMLICMTNIVRMIRIEDGVHNYLHVMLCAWFLFIGIRNLLVGQDKAVYITTMSTGSSSGFSHWMITAPQLRQTLTMKVEMTQVCVWKMLFLLWTSNYVSCTAAQQDDHSTHI